MHRHAGLGVLACSGEKSITPAENKWQIKYRKTADGWLTKRIYRIRKKAQKNGYQTDIDREYLKKIMVEKCPIFGYDLKYWDYGPSDKAEAQIDRIDNSLGYIKNNVRIISALANRMKADATDREMEVFAEWVIKRVK